MLKYFQSTLQFIKKYKKNIIFSSGAILIIFLLLYNPKSPSQTNKTLLNKSIQDTQEKTSPTYFLNTISTNKNVTGYSWLNNELIYSTPTGIFSANNNQPIINKSIKYITWSANGQAVYQSDNQWFHFKNKNNASAPISITNNNPIINLSGQYLATTNNNSLTILDLNNSNIVSTSIPEPISSIYWSLNKPILAISSINNIYLININGNIQTTKFKQPKNMLLGISPDANQLALASSHKLNLISNQGQITSSVEFTPESTLSAYWPSSNIFIIIETLAPDKFNRRIDYLWKITSDGKKQLLSNSMPITNRLNIKTSLFTNKDSTVIPLIENQNIIWLLSLVPNQLPFYSDQGISFYPASTLEH